MANAGQPWNGGMPVAAMRASHADRERAVDVLKAAYAEGRLNHAEYEQRVGLAYQAATYGELGRLVGDLPAGPVPPSAFLAATAPAAPAVPVPPTFLPPPQAPVNSLATTSLMCGLLGVAFGIPAVPAIVLGHKARAEIRAYGGAGEGAATAGLALGWLGIAMWVMVLLVMIVGLSSG